MDLSTQSLVTLKKDTGVHALIDCDIIARACASAADGRQYIIKEQIKDDKWVVYFVCKYKKEAVAYCELNEIPLDAIYIEYRPDPIENCLHSVKIMMQSILKATNASSFTGFLTGPTNFRNDISVTVPYKGTRWSTKKRAEVRKQGQWLEWLDKTEPKFKEARTPAHLEACKEYLIKYFRCIVSDNEEADDSLSQEQCKDLYGA